MLDPYFQHSSTLHRLKKWLYWLAVEYWVLRRAKRVVFTSDEESRLATQSFWLHRWNAATIPFGTSSPPDERDAQREAFLALHPYLRRKRFVLFLGRLHPKKGCDLLIEAFARIHASDPDLHLVVAGPDQQGWTVELQTLTARRGITQEVHWPGMLVGDAKWGAFRAAEVFILPSHQENFGIAVAEALACALPVLLTDKINIASEIALDHAGYVEADTLDGVECLLRRWIATPAAERSALSSRALACFERRYSMGETAIAIRALLEQPLS
jgi:glycosyltransferase involved in cell wall biosynthesis